MRKILVGVLSVAGLLAVVLALASGPAAAARSVVTVNSAAIAGEYTVSWETAGGCDPGAGTSGGAGSTTITVNATNEGTDDDNDGLPDLGTLTGTAGSDFVTVNDDCTYKWSASFTDAASGASCQVDGLPGAGADDTPEKITLEVNVSNCAPGGRITVTVGATPTKEGVPAVEDDPDTKTVDESVDALPAEYDPVSQGAVKETTFIVTATPVTNSKASCQAASAETEYSKASGTVAKLNVIGNNAIVDGSNATVNCEYDVEVHLPDGFAAAGDSNKDSGVPGTGAESAIELTVTVNQPRVILVQQVDGDSGGAAATYKWITGICAAGLPDPLGALTVGGIVPGETTVELREGRFDISKAVDADGTIDDLWALDHTATDCYVRTVISNLPDHCSASDPTNTVTANLADEVTGDNIVFVGVGVTCVEPVAEEPPADGGGDMDGPPEDMTGDGDEMSADDEMTGDGDEMSADDDKSDRTIDKPAG